MPDICKMKAGNLVFELDATDEKQLFTKLGHLQEIFDQTCGKCGSQDIQWVTRVVESGKKSYTYFEARCKSCRAKLSFGVRQEGGELFPKRKDDEGNYLPDSGWLKWSPSENKEV